jgi:hypothetical protein
MFLVLNTVNIMFIALLTLLSALSISGVAAYYSIIGLATIFPGAFIPVVLMGSVLEVGKLVCASWLYRNWTSTNLLLRSYLFFAVIVLSLVTSMGIFGFLSKAHLQNEFADGSIIQKIEIINSQIRTEENIIARQNEVIKRSFGTGTSNTVRLEQLNQRLVQLDREVEAYTKQGSSFFGGDSVKKGLDLKASQKAERDKINTEINRLTSTSSTSTSAAEQQIARSQQKITEFIQKRDPLMSERLKLEAEIGPIKYIAALAVDVGMSQKVDANSAVRWVIIILIFVFDPLAVLMLVAANQSLVRRFPIPVEKPREIIDLETPDLDTPVMSTGTVKEEPKIAEVVEDPAIVQWNDMINKMNEQTRIEKEQHLKDLEAQARDWQVKLEAFNAKVEKPEPRKIEIVPIRDEKKPENLVSYTLKDLISNTIVEEIKEEPTVEIVEEPKKKTEEIDINKPKNAKPFVLRTIKEPAVPIKPALPADENERKGMLNGLHQQHGKYQDVSDTELKGERDDLNKIRFLDVGPGRADAIVKVSEDKDITDDELNALLTEDKDDSEEFDIKIQKNKKVKILRQRYIQNAEQSEDTVWHKLNKLNLPESEKNEIKLPDLTNQKQEITDTTNNETVELAVKNTLSESKIKQHKARMLSNSEYQKLVSDRLNNLINQIDNKDITLEQLTNEDKIAITELLDNKNG